MAFNNVLWRWRFAVALTWLGIVGLQVWVEFDARAHYVLETETFLLNLASSFMKQIDDSVGIADSSVLQLVERLETGGTVTSVREILSQDHASQIAIGSQYRSIQVIDADGNLVTGSKSALSQNYADQDFFRHHRDEPDHGVFLSQPVFSRVTEQWIMSVSRRFNTPNGGFGGVVIAEIDLSHFVTQFSNYDLGGQSAILLSRTDGILLARYPPISGTIGRRFLNTTLFVKLVEHPAGTFSTVAVVDGVKRLDGYRRSDRYGLVTLVAMSEDHALVVWRGEAALRIAITLILGAAVGVLGLNLARQVNRSRAAEVALLQTEAFLDRASRVAGVGGWEVDVATKKICWACDDSRIHGFDLGHVPTLERVFDHFAPEAKPLIAAAYERCSLDGEGWDLELPFVRADGTRRWVRSVGELAADANRGGAARVTVALQDITSQVEHRLALEAANERTALVSESGQIGIWDWDIANDTLVWDDCMYRLYGMGRPTGKATYELWRKCLHPEDCAAAELAVRDAIEGVKPYSADFRIIWVDGSVHYIRGSATVKRDPAGRAIQMLGANWAVTELITQNQLMARNQQEITAVAAQYRLLADNSADMIFIINLQCEYRFVSPASKALIGYPPEELTGMSLLDVIHPEDTSHINTILTEIAAGGCDVAMATARGRHRDGHYVWVDAAFKLVRGSDSGEPIEITGSIRDVTARVAAEVALRESEGRYRLLLESGVIEAFYMLDPSGIIQTWNAGAERIKGWKADEIIGRDFATFFTPEDMAAGAPARLLEMARDIGQVANEGWRVRKDGSRFLAESVIDAIYTDDDSTLVGFAKVARDITDRRIEEEQREIIIEATPTGILIVNESGTISLSNSHAERIFGYSKNELLGQKPEILVPAMLRAAHSGLRSAFAAGRVEREMASGRAVTGVRQDGSEVSVEIMLRPVKTPRGAIVVASLRDVTERVRLAAEQQERERQERQAIEATNARLDNLARHYAKVRDEADSANLAKSRFLAGVSHELRTPLHGILGYAQLLKLDGNLNANQAARVDAMLETGKHLLAMVAHVLELSEIEAGRVEIRPTTFAVMPVVQGCMDIVRPVAEAKCLKISISTAPGTPIQLKADVTLLRRILINLLGNASKFTSAGGIALLLRPSPGGHALRIEVADTGAGIPPEQRQRLFQEFERLDTDATHASEGAGLGLAVSARLAVLMGGRLGHDDNPGGGSVFWLELPLNLEAPSYELAVPIAEAIERPLHVLVVDDSEINRDVAGSFLGKAGHQVTLASGGEAAIAAASDRNFDVILMDVRMPGMDGLEATRRIRALEGSRGRVPIIALTAHTFTEQVAACRTAGMDDHLGKPFEMEDLVAAVARAAKPGRSPFAAKALTPFVASPETRAFTGTYIPVLDSTAFEAAFGSLAEWTSTAHVRSLLEIAETLVHDIEAQDSLRREGATPADTAHALAGSAGLFGFTRLAAVARQVQYDMETEKADVARLTDRLRAAIDATREAITARVQADFKEVTD